ncbi:hypothetical protein SFR_6524 [Streptomyces sp. FR-008]|nr:hypothetical protein SFR_6524 [Streptomyces sp. FR-008]
MSKTDARSYRVASRRGSVAVVRTAPGRIVHDHRPPAG